MKSQGQTHWLKQCASDADCGGELACECHVCVATCDADRGCNVSGLETECFAADSSAIEALCGARQPPSAGLCLEPCADACGDGQACASGACITETMTMDPAPDSGSDDPDLPIDGGRDAGSIPSHWLERCDSDDDCGDGELSCECGVCVVTCEADRGCNVSGLETECIPSAGAVVAALCGPGNPSSPSICLEPCPCSDGELCASGLACIPEPMTIVPPPDGGIASGSRGPCAPQRFQGVGTCEPGPIYYWTGFDCYGLVACDCIGPECDDGYPSMQACMDAHAQCTGAVEGCGGLTGVACDPGEYCEILPQSACGVTDGGGTCQPIPTACDGNYEPVCGCNGEQYGNACQAAMAGAAIASFAECGSCAPACTGAPPDEAVEAACRDIRDEHECTRFETGGFPEGCRWITESSEPCLAP